MNGSPISAATLRRRLGLVAALSPRALLRRPGAGPRLAFPHIPKTAGATVASMLAGVYPDAEVGSAGNYFRNPKETRARIFRARWCGEWAGAQVVVGHVPYGLFARHLPPDTRYMTFVREPVDRVLSHYHRHIERKSRTTDSLEQALGAQMPELSNLATRFLCGDPAPLGELRASALDDAKENLQRFEFVGIQERFEESIVLLQRMLGTGPAPYVNRHVSADRPGVDEIGARERALIEEHNRLDAELYAFAGTLADRAVAEADEGFAAEVEALRALSRDANEAAIRTAREWLDRELPTGAVRPIVPLYSAADEAGVDLSALKHVLERSPVKKCRDASGRKAFTRSD